MSAESQLEDKWARTKAVMTAARDIESQRHAEMQGRYNQEDDALRKAIERASREAGRGAQELEEAKREASMEAGRCARELDEAKREASMEAGRCAHELDEARKKEAALLEFFRLEMSNRDDKLREVEVQSAREAESLTLRFQSEEALWRRDQASGNEALGSLKRTLVLSEICWELRLMHKPPRLLTTACRPIEIRVGNKWKR